MADSITILQDLEAGKQWRATLVEKKYSDMTKGCGCCGNNLLECFNRVVKALIFRTDLGIFDEVTDKLHSDMMELMGPYIIPVAPHVDAGPPVSVTLPDNTAMLLGSVTAGDNPIATIQWTQVSGPNTAGISDSGMPVTGLTGLVLGTYVFRLTATDIVSKTASDTTQVVVAAAPVQAFYGYNSNGVIPDLTTIESSADVSITGNTFTIPFKSDPTPRYYWVAYPLTYPVMGKWIDPDDILNRGNIGQVTDLFGPYSTVGSYRVTISQYPTQMTNTIFEE